MISKDAVKKSAFDSSQGSIGWKWSDLREWLNNTYVNEAFSENEKERICSVNMDEGDSEAQRRWPSDNNTKEGEDTDLVFLLSTRGAEKYFSSNEKRSIEKMWWLTKYSGSSNRKVPYVQEDGVVNSKGFNPYYSGMGVRPAIWIDVSDF